MSKLDIVSRIEVEVPINEIASSHMARRTFTRYRPIDIDMKKDLVKILEGQVLLFQQCCHDYIMQIWQMLRF